MDDMGNKQRIRLCSDCEWCAVEVNSNGDDVYLCMCAQSDKYLDPVSMIEDCGEWEEKMFD